MPSARGRDLDHNEFVRFLALFSQPQPANKAGAAIHVVGAPAITDPRLPAAVRRRGGSLLHRAARRACPFDCWLRVLGKASGLRVTHTTVGKLS